MCDYMNTMLSEVEKEQTVAGDGGNMYRDEIDAQVDQMDADKQYEHCYACGKQYIPNNKMCRKNLKQDQTIGATSGNTFELRPAKYSLQQLLASSCSVHLVAKPSPKSDEQI